MENFKNGYLYCNSENYGKIGKPTKIHDDGGTKLFVGDVVETFDDRNRSYGNDAIVENGDHQFVMGIACDCKSDGRIVGGWHVKKRRSYTEIADGEGIGGIIYHTKGKPEFKVGQIYRVEKANTEDWNGSIIKISGEEQKCFGKRFTTKVVRGKSPDSFDEGSMFANEITLLTGKEIGEAIRKWDADHAKKPEPEYNEVKRHAKVGEYIKIVNAENSHGKYQNGEIHKVKKSSTAIGGFLTVRLDVGGPYVNDSEYVVLEGYKPEQKEEHRKAKVGDTIEIVRGNYTSCAAHVGAIGKVTKTDEAQVMALFEPYMDGCPYAVEHGDYEIVSSGKHPYTADEIIEAKKRCGEMMVEAFDDGNTFSLRFLDKNESKDSHTVGCELARFNRQPGSAGMAKCSDHDEYNVWIGRCVALCKALHKPIPAFIMGDGKRHFSLKKARELGKGAYGAKIHCKSRSECEELSKALDALGYVWCDTREKLTERFYEDDMTYSVPVTVHNGVGNAGEGKCDNSVEFSDCLVEG